MNEVKVAESRTCPYFTHVEELCGLINHSEVTVTSLCRKFLEQFACMWQRLSKWLLTPLIRTLVIRIANYPDLFGPSEKFVENSTKLTCLEITGYRINYSTV